MEEKSDSDNDDEGKEDDEEEEDEDAHLAMNVPKLSLKHMLTEEQIQEKEDQFTSLLQRVKEALKSTVFEFADVKKALEVPVPMIEEDAEPKVRVASTVTGQDLMMKLDHALSNPRLGTIPEEKEQQVAEQKEERQHKQTEEVTMLIQKQSSSRELRSSLLSEDKDEVSSQSESVSSLSNNKKSSNSSSTSSVRAKIQNIQQHQKKSLVLDAQSILSGAATTSIMNTDIGAVDFTDIKITKHKDQSFLPSTSVVATSVENIPAEANPVMATSVSAPSSPGNNKSDGENPKPSIRPFKPKSVGYDVRDAWPEVESKVDENTNNQSDKSRPAPKFAAPSANTATMLLSMTNDYNVVNTTLRSASAHTSANNTPR